jgi:hypothetical protein
LPCLALPCAFALPSRCLRIACLPFLVPSRCLLALRVRVACLPCAFAYFSQALASCTHSCSPLLAFAVLCFQCSSACLRILLLQASTVPCLQIVSVRS